MFASFEELERLYGRLPDEFGAGEVGRTGLTGGRRHMLVHHLAEHPAFDCSLVSRQPLTARKVGGAESTGSAESTESAETTGSAEPTEPGRKPRPTGSGRSTEKPESSEEVARAD